MLMRPRCRHVTAGHPHLDRYTGSDEFFPPLLFISLNYIPPLLLTLLLFKLLSTLKLLLMMLLLELLKLSSQGWCENAWDCVRSTGGWVKRWCADGLGAV
jgi:hypothetical protein